MAADIAGRAADWLLGTRDRLRCRLFRIHGAACRGRPDHIVDGNIIGYPDRWPAARIDPPLPRCTRLRLAIVRRIDDLAYWLTCHGAWRAAIAVYRAAGLWP